jgi:hypothetical protein
MMDRDDRIATALITACMVAFICVLAWLMV